MFDQQRDRPGPVVAKLDLRTDVYAGSDVINDSDRNGIEVGEVVHLMKNLQQDEQAQARGLPPRVSSPPLEFFDVRRIAGAIPPSKRPWESADRRYVLRWPCRTEISNGPVNRPYLGQTRFTMAGSDALPR